MPDAAPFHLYILSCADGTLYTGIALDVDARLDEHRHGKRGAKYLRGRMPVELVFTAAVGDRGVAQRLESRVKKLSRDQKRSLIDGVLTLDGLL